MSLRDEIQADIAEAFDADLADAVQAFNGVRTIKGAYDPVTGTSTDTEEKYKGRGVFGSYKITEVDGQHVLNTDTKLTALQNELIDLDDDGTELGQGTPKMGDDINEYRVIDIAKDPAAATWAIQLRER